MYAAETPSSTGRTPGTASNAAVTPVTTATSTSIVPPRIPAKKPAERRTPYAEPAAARLTVAGPGLPIVAAPVTRSRAAAPHGTAATSSDSAINALDSLASCARRYEASTGIVLNDPADRGATRSASG